MIPVIKNNEYEIVIENVTNNSTIRANVKEAIDAYYAQYGVAK